MSGLLLRMAMVICVFFVGLTAVAPSWAEKVGVRAARTNDYGRIVFDWKKNVTHDLKLQNRSLTVYFGRPIDASYESILRVLRKYVVDVRTGDDGRSVVIGLKQNFDAYSFDSGRNVIVEIADSPVKSYSIQSKNNRTESSVTKVRQQVAAQEIANGNLPRIGVRSGVHANYSRIVFDWRDLVGYQFANEDGLVRIKFRKAANLQVAAINNNPPPYVGGIRSRVGDAETNVMLTIPKTSRVKHFLIGPKVVIDIRRPTGSNEVSALPAEKNRSEEVSTKRLSQQVNIKQKKSDQLRSNQLPAKNSAKTSANNEKQAVSTIKRSENTKPSRTLSDKALKNKVEEKSRAKPSALTPPNALSSREDKIKAKASAISQSTLASKNPDKKGDVDMKGSVQQASDGQKTVSPKLDTETASSVGSSAGSGKPVLLKPLALTPKNNKQAPSRTAAPSMPKEKTSDDAKVGAEGKKSTEPQTINLTDGVKLRFPWDTPVAAAVFRRIGFIWVLFDKASKVDLDALNLAGGIDQFGRPIFKSVKQIPVKNGTALRIKTFKRVNTSMARDGNDWILHFYKQPMRPATTIEIKAQPDGPDGPRLFLPLTKPGKPIGVTDPLIGDNLVVVPIYALGHGIARKFEYPQLEVLLSGQGLVVRPKIDGLRVQAKTQGIEISFGTRLAISPVSDEMAASARMAATGPLEKLLDLAQWEVKELSDFNERKKELLADVVKSSGAKREVERMNLAQFYFANGFNAEALGVLKRLEGESPAIVEEPEFRLIRGASNYFLHRLSEAANDLSHASLEKNGEANFWRAAVIASSGEMLAAAAELRRTGAIAQGYPKALKIPTSILVAEAAVELGDVTTAKAFIKALKKVEPNEDQKAEINYIQGKAFNVVDDPDGAIDKWEKALGSRNMRVRAKAALARANLMLKHNRIEKKEAIAELEKLRFVWRGDRFEFDLLRRLAALYLEQGIYRNGLLALRNVVEYYRNNEDTPQVAEQMANVFSRLYLTDAAEKMPAVTAIALYKEFKELTPAGAKGDEIIRKLADKLARIDLLEQAAEILEGQIRFRLSGPLKAEVGARLAVIYLLARQHDRALNALNLSAEDGLSPELTSQRRHLKARAMMGLGQQDMAIDLLEHDREIGADSLRAEIFWKNGDWAKASNSLRRVIRENGAEKEQPLTERQAGDVLNYAISLALSGNERGLGLVRRDFGRAVESTSMKDAFRLVTAPTELGMIAPNSVMARVKLAENFKTFLGEYRRKLKEKGLSALTEQTVSRNGEIGSKSSKEG